MKNKGKIIPTDLTEQEFPKLLEYREAAIEYRQKAELKSLDKKRKQKEITPDTYRRKRHELEVWVTKEEDDVERVKKIYEEEWQPAKMIVKSQQNYESIKRILKSEVPMINNLVNHHNQSKSSQNVPSKIADEIIESQRTKGGVSHREQSDLLNMIYTKDRKLTENSAKRDKSNRKGLSSDEDELVESEGSSGFDKKRKHFDVQNVDAFDSSSLGQPSDKVVNSGNKAAPSADKSSSSGKRKSPPKE